MPVLVGTAADARGLALAGVDGHVCTTRQEVERAVDEILQSVAHPLLILSSVSAHEIASRIASWRRDGTGPPFVVLPPDMEHPIQPIAEPRLKPGLHSERGE
ncbi:MAG TPA: V-type ATP synthase subunit F [Thermoanaerobaculia bacterium]|nr:V-type ATP synthase subunit F [Thermoanaerobaculia bacterium]